jgi:hypothetical protein
MQIKRYGLSDYAANYLQLEVLSPVSSNYILFRKGSGNLIPEYLLANIKCHL